jgi:3'-5' exonuclease
MANQDETRAKVKYLIFDAEAIADAELVSRIQYPNDNLSPDEALKRYREALFAKNGTDILPVTYMLPISIAVAKVDPQFKLLDIATLDPPEYRPSVMTRKFWQGWHKYGCPTLVTFNGRGYDLPLLELAAFRFGLAVPNWFNTEARSYEQSRNRYNTDAHLDLYDFVSNFGATKLSGGLNLLANLIGKPGKSGVDGSMVQDMYLSGEVAAINDYCRCDVLDTYFVFIRTRVLMGKLTLEAEQQLVAETKTWLEQQATSNPAYAHYLEHWGDWNSPAE